MWKKILLFLSALQASQTAHILPCPEYCKCEVIVKEHIKAKCSSLDFLTTSHTKLLYDIKYLDLSDSAQREIDPRIKYFKNLRSLDLSFNNIDSTSHFPYLPKLKYLNLRHNDIEDLRATSFPKSLEILDLSWNSIAHIPKDWSSLKALKTLHLNNNPVVCDCDTVSNFKELKKHVHIPEDVTCQYTPEFSGRSVSSLNCSVITSNLLNLMMGDQGVIEAEETHDSDDQEFMRTDTKTPKIEQGEESKMDNLFNDFEGSGDEGSGDFELPKACISNCSTPDPVGSNDEQHASPPPTLREQFKIVFGDLFGNPKESEVETTEGAVSSSEITPDLATSPKEESSTEKASDKDGELISTNATKIGQLERASVGSSSDSYTYFIVGIVSLVLIALTVCFVVRRRGNKQKKGSPRRNSLLEDAKCQEMKTLNENTNGGHIEKPVNEKGTSAEKTPLINGNGTRAVDEARQGNLPLDDSLSNQEDSVEIRPKEELTPPKERVTTKVIDLPDSVPKTPLLVHRSLNSDGEIVTTTVG